MFPGCGVRRRVSARRLSCRPAFRSDSPSHVWAASCGKHAAMKTSGETGVSLGRFVLVVGVGGVLALAGIRVGFDAGHVAQEAATFVSTKGTTRIDQTVGAVVSPRTVAVKVPATVTATRTVVRRPVVTEPPMGNGITV